MKEAAMIGKQDKHVCHLLLDVEQLASMKLAACLLSLVLGQDQAEIVGISKDIDPKANNDKPANKIPM